MFTFALFAAFAGLAFVLNCAVPPDYAGAEDFVTATLGVPIKQLAAWMDVCESQITRWRQTGNIPGGRLQKLANVVGPGADTARKVLRRYSELQAQRGGAIVIEREMVDAGVEAFNALLQAFGWRPVAVKASLEPVSAGSSCGCGKRLSGAA